MQVIELFSVSSWKRNATQNIYIQALKNVYILLVKIVAVARHLAGWAVFNVVWIRCENIPNTQSFTCGIRCRVMTQ